MKRLSAAANLRILLGALIALATVVAAISVVRLDTFGSRGSGIGRKFIDDITELARIDPNLILYEESSVRISTGFEQSQAIAVDSQGRIYVVGDNAVRVFAPNGDPINQISLSQTALCVETGDDGAIYLGTKDHVEVFDAAGQRIATWEGLGDDAFLTAIAVAGDNVFVADAGNRIVLHYDRSGKILNRIGKKDLERNVPGFMVPSPYFDLAVSKDGLLRVVNPGRLRVEAYTLEGDFEFSWGESSVAVEGFCGCCNPADFALLPDGGFVTSEKGLARVKVYDSQGTFVGVVAGSDQLLEGGAPYIAELPEQHRVGGFDVAVDPDGRVLILDRINNAVRFYTKKKTG
ncbi:MAG TPA: NHL repeat-containing protein [Sedimentisphaerales bacterium]|nr:NHL repeat-containing protein [Sedimentisphaerales bacterium]